MRRTLQFLLLSALLLNVNPIQAQKKNHTDKENYYLKSSLLSGLSFRSIGPALTSGRVADIAVNPDNTAEYYIASASGGLWKTINHGTDFQPIFDHQGSYSIGCITLDPSNPHTVWVGTGENNGQRSVPYGDGVYRSDDGGKSWKNMGLKKSEHIGKIVIDPDNSDIVYVAAQGPLWSSGGDRGLYKTTDGGKNWEKVLDISEYTGVNDVVMDPRNAKVLYASAWQRERKVFTFISGGPESAIYKSKDAGKHWEKLSNGIPKGDIGRIGLAISPQNPDYVYAIIDGTEKTAGFYRSTDRGASWEKMSNYHTSGNYYQEIYCHPYNKDIVYSMNTWAMFSKDGGKTFQRVGEPNKHVDNHCMWIDPDNTDHFIMGCDGGLYETWDNAQTWQFKANLPITQFYKVATDNDFPFYHVYGGTQDNASLGGPSRTINSAGITNADWYNTVFGDGFQTQVDPEDPDIVYSQWQYGGLVRHDRKSGENIGIQPMEKPGEPALRWNWDAPLIISPHSHTRLYFAANKLFRSDDRGNTWTAISGDLTRQLDRNKMKVMGRVWSMDAVEKNRSTSIYGQCVALAESPLQEGLIYVGTDDGLIQVTEDNGQNWRKIESFPDIPAMTYVNDLVASKFDANTVFAVFNNHKNGDFKPYILKSNDKGKSWSHIDSGLPSSGSVYCFAQDYIDANLLFCGTEFGVFFSNDAGQHWISLKAGLPTIAVYDMTIQQRESDLVLATFGRGFYILDNYSPLRQMNKENLDKDAMIFAVKDAWMFLPKRILGLSGKAFQGASFFSTPNPEIGSVITYYLKEELKTKKQERQEKEQKIAESGGDVAYPDLAEMHKEDNEEAPFLLFTITDDAGNVVRRIKKTGTAGIHRLVWDFRYPSPSPASLKAVDVSIFADDDVGYPVVPGKYQVSMAKSVDGIITDLVSPVPLLVKPLGLNKMQANDPKALLAINQKTAELFRTVQGANHYLSEAGHQLDLMKTAINNSPKVNIRMLEEIRDVEQQLSDLKIKLQGDASLAKRQFETNASISDRISNVVYNLWYTSAAPTNSMKDNLKYAGDAFSEVMAALKKVDMHIKRIRADLEKSGAPWTPGQLPEWNGN